MCVMQHFLKGENVGLTLCKQFKAGKVYAHCFISDLIIESSFVSNKTSEITSVFPLYLYGEDKQKGVFKEQTRKPNFNDEIIQEFAKAISLIFTSEKEAAENTFAPIDVLDYIYAVLHSTNYRLKFKEFLKIDFPRVPFPIDQNQFWQLVALGKQIREIHLLESSVVEDYITSYPIGGSNEVIKPEYKEGKVWINTEQYFDNVPQSAWEFYIGSYQPAQKWLKDRKGNMLDFEDILHYQKIIIALFETDRLMKEIDKIEII